MLDTAPVIAVTKCGVGVFDMEWWRPRLSLFRAVTLPSLVSAAKGWNFHWFILLDEAMPTEALETLREAVNEVGGQDVVRLQFVKTSIDANKVALTNVRSVLGDRTRGIVIRIDDDDAISDDAIEAVVSRIEDASKPAVITLSEGFALDAPQASVGELQYANHTSNTYYYGNLSEISRVLWGNHTRAVANAQKAGYQTATVKGEGRYFVYTFHRQADGDYLKRLKKVSKWSPASEELESRFGIRLDQLSQWRELQADSRATIGLTWRRTMPEISQIRRLYRQVDQLKRDIVFTNSAIFDPRTPFLYLLEPTPSLGAKSGRVRFKGVATPGARVQFSLAGNSGQFNLCKTVVADPETGEFQFQYRLNKFRWRVRLELFVEEDNEHAVKQWEFQLVVK